MDDIDKGRVACIRSCIVNGLLAGPVSASSFQLSLTFHLDSTTGRKDGFVVTAARLGAPSMARSLAYLLVGMMTMAWRHSKTLPPPGQ